MIKYSIEQKVALVKKLELFKLEKNLSKPKLARLLGCTKVAISGWERERSLPKAQLCYQIEKVLIGFNPELYSDYLNSDDIIKQAQKMRAKLYKNKNQY